MELKEATEILEDRDMLIDTLFETYNQSTVKPFDKAIDAILDYIENNSISKEKIKEAIKYEKEIAKEPASCGYSGTALHGYTARVLKELLGE